MRINDTYKLRQLGSKHFIVRSDSSRSDFSEVFTLNETAAFLWKKAVESPGFDEAMMAEWLGSEYDVTGARAEEDVRELVACWKEYGFVLLP